MPYTSTSLRIVRKFFPKVRKINDATKDFMIEVTKADSSHAKVRDHTVCAMAVACKRTLKLDGVIISVSMAYLVKGDTATRATFPESVSREVVSFDRNGGFDEGIYHLSKIPKGKKLGVVHHKSEKDRHTGTGETKPPRHITGRIRALVGNKMTYTATP